MQAVAEIVPERQPELAAGFHQPEHGVARHTTIALIVPPEILRLTRLRRSFSDALVWSGVPGQEWLAKVHPPPGGTAIFRSRQSELCDCFNICR